MTIRCSALLLSCFFFGQTIYAQTLNQRPVKAIGAPRLLATQSNPGALDSVNPNYVAAQDLFNPTAVALDFSSTPPSVYVADSGNNRVLGWKFASQLSNGAPADIVIGQSSFFGTLPQGPTGLTIGLNNPTGLAVDKTGNVYVADTNNNRILRFPRPFNQPDVLKTPDLIIGQTGFNGSTANPLGVTATSLFLNPSVGFPLHIGITFDPDGNLIVADVGNNRVLRYPVSALKAGANGPSADLVIGQANLTTATAAAANLRTSRNILNDPTGVAFDSVGRLYVSDSLARVLVFAPGLASNASAVRLLGISVFAPNQPVNPYSPTIIGFAASVSIGPGDKAIVVDAAYHRILVFDSFDSFPAESATLISPAASTIIGQNLPNGHLPNEGLRIPNNTSLSSPLDAAASSNELYVVDSGNNRVLNFPYSANVPLVTATRVLGQVGYSLFAPNLVEGREFNLVASGNLGSIVIDTNSTPPHLYVADPGNNRILCFRDFNSAKGGDYADIVIGQQNLFSTAFNITNDPTTPTQTGLSRPTALALDTTGNLYVADSGNSRVLRFPQPFAQASSTGQPADLVIGQANFTSTVTSATNRNMQTPAGVAVLSDGSLMVSDATLNRVLYFPQPLSNGMIATKVLGQADFNSPTTGSGSVSPVFNPARLTTPRQIAVDSQDRIYLCDTGNSRIAIFDTIGNLQPTFAPPAISLTNGLNQPVGITVAGARTVNAGQIWVSDFANNALFHYPPYTQLLTNPNADQAQSAFHPLSAAFDTFGDLSVADSANRILLFVPQLVVVNGANFASGPVAPGTIVSVFSAPAPNALSTTATLAPSTANFSDLPNPLPIPTTLADIQVLVNGAPAPLFYVSPGQINLPLPTTLPTSGVVDLEIVSRSTSRIYGLTEVSLAAVSPALFTLAGSGRGQLAALNSPDNSVNTASKALVRGQVLTLFGTGEGLVPNGPPDGSVATGITPTTDRPRIVIGGIDVDDSNVLYSGLAPGLAGVWQINVLVPQEVTAGSQIPVVVYLRSSPTQMQAFVALR